MLRFLIPVSICLLLGSACSSRIHTETHNTGHENDLRNMQRYCWALDHQALESAEPTGGHPPQFNSAVQSSANAVLAKKGYQQSACQNADFLIDYRMGIHEDINAPDIAANDSLHDYGLKWSLGNGQGVEYQGLSKGAETVVVVQHGTLHIAAFTADGQFLWHASAEKTLDPRDPDSERINSVRKATHKIMRGFPSR